MAIRIFANAKLNLFLDVATPVCADGYHRIETLIGKIDLCDEIILEKAENLSLKVISPWKIPSDDSNLCLKAAKALMKKREFPGVKITLLKRIPPGSGLGGGSSDAAAVLKGIKTLYKIPLKEKQLIDAAILCGSDVPLFLREETFCRVSGKGEKVFPADVKIPGIVVIWPEGGVSTAGVYRKLDEIYPSHKISRVKNLFFNILEIPAFKLKPFLARRKEKFLKGGAEVALLSGSGGTVWGIFKRKISAMEFCRINRCCKIVKFLR